MNKIIAGSSSKSVAHSLSEYLKIGYIDARTEHFADLELRVQLIDQLTGDNVIIVQSTCNPANDNLIELLLLTDAAKNAGARKCIALLPYFGYSRQDRFSYQWGPVSVKLVLNLLKASGVDCVITLDIHSEKNNNFSEINIHNIESIPLFIPFVSKETTVIVSPDFGSAQRAKKLSEVLNVEFIVISKNRSKSNECKMNFNNKNNLEGKNCLIIDDIVDTGETLIKAVDLLKVHGALSVEALVTHAVLSGNAKEKIEESALSKIFITNSIEHQFLPPKFRVIDIAPYLATILASKISLI